MISEIDLVEPEKTKRSASLLVEPECGLDFILQTARRIDETPLCELESRLPAYIQRQNQNAFVLGGVLERIRREKFWNPGSRHPQNALFERWVEDTCQYSGRKARYLISVYVGLVRAAIPSWKISDIGWSKLRMIAPLLRPIDGENLDAETMEQNRAHNDELIRLARSKGRKALEAELRYAATHDEVSRSCVEARRKPRQYLFKVEEGADAVDAALDKIANETGHTGGAALVDMANAINALHTMPALEAKNEASVSVASLS